MDKKHDKKSGDKEAPMPKGSEQSVGPDDSLRSQTGAQSNDKSIDWQDVAKRALADLDNYKKQELALQGKRDRITAYRHAIDVAEIYSAHKRAMNALELTVDDEKITKIYKGMLDILVMYNKMLNRWGAEIFSVEQGEDFDPVSMEAVSYEDIEVGEDKVIDTFEVGVRELESKEIIKPAKVRVGK